MHSSYFYPTDPLMNPLPSDIICTTGLSSRLDWECVPGTKGTKYILQPSGNLNPNLPACPGSQYQHNTIPTQFYSLIKVSRHFWVVGSKSSTFTYIVTSNHSFLCSKRSFKTYLKHKYVYVCALLHCLHVLLKAQYSRTERLKALTFVLDYISGSPDPYLLDYSPHVA